MPRPVQGHLWRGFIVQLLGPHVGRAGGDSVSGDISLSCFEVMFSFVLCEAVGVHGGLWRGLVMHARFVFSRRNPVVAPMTLLTVFPPRGEEEDSLLTGPVLFWLMGLWSLGPVVLWPVSLEKMLLMEMWCLVQVALWPVLVKAMLLMGLWCLGPVALWPVLVEAMLLMELWCLGPVVLWPVLVEAMLLMLWPVVVEAMLLMELWCLGPVALWPVLEL